MISTARIAYDRDYFELQYDEWLAHRAKFKQYEIWLAVALTILGASMAILFRSQWLPGTLLACAGLFEFGLAATHKRRWVNARISNSPDDKTVDLVFDSDSLTATSANGTATMRLAGFTDFVQASKGFFLIPDAGMSIYVPRSAVAPPESYSQLVDVLASAVGSVDRLRTSSQQKS